MYRRFAGYLQRLNKRLSHVRQIQTTVLVIAILVLMILIAVPKAYHAIFNDPTDRAASQSSSSFWE